MAVISRRGLLAAGGATLALSACANGVGGRGAQTIDARVDATRDYLFSRFPGTQTLAQQSQGVLYMPLVTEAGFGFGGAYGRGALRIKDVTVDYYSAAKASFGLQIGAQQYAHAIFFKSEQALADFRRSPGWAASADIRYATPDMGASIGKETTEFGPNGPAAVEAYVFGQSGLIVGASLAGVKYTRIIP